MKIEKFCINKWFYYRNKQAEKSTINIIFRAIIYEIEAFSSMSSEMRDWKVLFEESSTISLHIWPMTKSYT